LDDVNTQIEKLAEQVRKSDDVFISLVPIKDYRMEFGISTMRMDQCHDGRFLFLCHYGH
jgi:putative ABC transport system permease protein